MTGTALVWLTQEAHDRLHGELRELRAAGHERRSVEKDDGPNDEGAPDIQWRQTRIRELEDLLLRAVVGETPPDDGIAEPGMVLTVRFDQEDGTETFLLGVPDGFDGDELEVYSPESPLGQALAGARQGEARSYRVPNGATMKVRLIQAVPYGQHRQRRAAG
ncbi:GreA/GreB family elongation factor [Nocardia sp. NPDC049707]|jgi:transcription elongation GreA/GreB family factor|uniref:GreA/GreB family elongation factor n=1 Tax=Nocardia sp. NPDC049707 TaxID=3154735 RepID=UPI00342B96BF